MIVSSEEVSCNICCDDVLPQNAVTLSCSHGWYCLQCVGRHAEARLSNGSAHVPCPECTLPIPERDLRRMLRSSLLERLLTRSLEQAVSAVSDLWACPTPNCPMRVALEDGDIPRLYCDICNKESCLRCGAQPYHKNMTCEEYAEKLRSLGRKEDEDRLQQWMEETGTKQCPTCGMGVTKLNIDKQKTQYEECHKMLCANCSTKFCFKCCAILTDTYSCGCSINAHGFCDPKTGKRINHLRAGAERGRGKLKAGANNTVPVKTKVAAKAKVPAISGVGRGRGRGR